MATVKGPLFSVSASGTFRGMEFRTGSGATQVAAPRLVNRHRSPAQQAHAARFQIAVTAWNGLDAPARQSWRTAALGTGSNGYQLYISEYISQAITPPGQPITP